MRTAPPTAFLPNNAPCGPRSTSTRSRSSRSRIVPCGAPHVHVVHVNRHARLERQRVVAQADTADERRDGRAIPGAQRRNDRVGHHGIELGDVRVRLRASRFSAVKADMASGVSCSRSSLYCAETTTSSRPPASPLRHPAPGPASLRRAPSTSQSTLGTSASSFPLKSALFCRREAVIADRWLLQQQR